MNGDKNASQPVAESPEPKAETAATQTPPTEAVEAKPAPEETKPAQPKVAEATPDTIEVVEPAKAAEPAPSETAPITAPTPEAQPQPGPEPAATAAAPEQHFFTAEVPSATSPEAAAPRSNEQPMEWTSADAPSHPKPSGWLGMVSGGAVLIAVIIYLGTHDLFSAISIIVAAVILIVFNARKTNAVHYRLDQGGIVINQKHYPYSQFRSFMVDVEGPATSINLMPLQRFMPTLTVVCDHSIQSEVTDHIAGHLPVEPYTRDAVDTLLNKLHF